MNTNQGLPLVAPRVAPALDAAFRPAALANRAFLEGTMSPGHAQPLRLALEQADGSMFHFSTQIFAQHTPAAAANFTYVERLVKFLLWGWGGWRIHFDGPRKLGEQLIKYIHETPAWKFDSNIIGEKIYDRPIEIVVTRELPPPRAATRPLGRHLNGCRIGFDLGGSDRKVAAIIDGRVVWSEETEWDPYYQPDPQYHWDGIMDSLRRAAEHLPHIDAIGGSAAGVYVDNQVKFASLFRGVAPDAFEKRVRNIFRDLKHVWHDVPFDVANDGDVTALMGSMSLGGGGVLGIALGTSTAGGFVTADGRITPWLNEIAFVPVDYRADAPRDEWSGDRGCIVQYLSQQAVGRLHAPAGIDLPHAMPLPAKLKEVQSLMKVGDPRARTIYETVGVYLGYALPEFATVYDYSHVLLLGRGTTGPGGDIIMETAREVLRVDFPELASKVDLRMPGEKDKRHGQAIAAASLPELGETPILRAAQAH